MDEDSGMLDLVNYEYIHIVWVTKGPCNPILEGQHSTKQLFGEDQHFFRHEQHSFGHGQHSFWFKANIC